MQAWDDEHWLQNGWMHKTTCQDLCAKLAPAIYSRDASMRAGLTGKKQVSIALWKVAMPDCYQSARNLVYTTVLG